MKILRPLAIGLTLSLLCTVPALAQDSRPGANTIFGDTGIWFVPTGETLPKGRWSVGAQLVNFDRSEGFSDITDIGGMFARVEPGLILAREEDAVRRANDAGVEVTDAGDAVPCDPAGVSVVRVETTAELREGFLSYFESKGHVRLSSGSLVPATFDPSVLP